MNDLNLNSSVKVLKVNFYEWITIWRLFYALGLYFGALTSKPVVAETCESAVEIVHNLYYIFLYPLPFFHMVDAIKIRKFLYFFKLLFSLSRLADC